MAWGKPKRKLSKKFVFYGSWWWGQRSLYQGSCLHSVRSKAAEEMGLETGAKDCGSIPHPRVWWNQWPLRKQQELIYDNRLRTEHTPVSKAWHVINNGNRENMSSVGNNYTDVHFNNKSVSDWQCSIPPLRDVCGSIGSCCTAILIHLKLNILLLFMHRHVISNLLDFLSSVKDCISKPVLSKNNIGPHWISLYNDFVKTNVFVFHKKSHTGL